MTMKTKLLKDEFDVQQMRELINRLVLNPTLWILKKSYFSLP